jgi:tetratricopeptide (TPR) repeat protein
LRIVTVVSLVVGCIGLLAFGGTAEVPPNERGPDDPIWVEWMDPANPRDMTILDYWDREKRGELGPAARVDLGTMLFERGYPKDAVRMYRRALKEDSGLYEAWFRIGLVSHRQGDFDDARYAYKKCLKQLIGHGWCNFYLGLLEEQTQHPSKALEYYQRAFAVAPELADPNVNPEVLYSRLHVGSLLIKEYGDRFSDVMPLKYLEPDDVASVRSMYEPTPTPADVGQPTTGGATAKEQPTTGAEPASDAAPSRARPAVTPTPPPKVDESKVESSPFGSRYRQAVPSGTPTDG